jgi:hypothetical protein
MICVIGSNSPIEGQSSVQLPHDMLGRVVDPAPVQFELTHSGQWRTAVWSLRVGYVGLAIAFAGLIVLLLGGTSLVLAVGVIIWLAVVVVTLTGFLLARHELAEPRPSMWSMRLMLIHDTVHQRP